jgi:hypothetical protein
MHVQGLVVLLTTAVVTLLTVSIFSPWETSTREFSSPDQTSYKLQSSVTFHSSQFIPCTKVLINGGEVASSCTQSYSFEEFLSNPHQNMTLDLSFSAEQRAKQIDCVQRVRYTRWILIGAAAVVFTLGVVLSGHEGCCSPNAVYAGSLITNFIGAGATGYMFWFWNKDKQNFSSFLITSSQIRHVVQQTNSLEKFTTYVQYSFVFNA